MIRRSRIFEVSDNLPEVVDSPRLGVRRAEHSDVGASAGRILKAVGGATDRGLISAYHGASLSWGIDEGTAIHVIHGARNRADRPRTIDSRPCTSTAWQWHWH